MAVIKDIDKVSLTYADSHNPDVITMGIDEGRLNLRFSPIDAIKLAERLREAVRMSGYEVVARKRQSRRR